MRLLVVRYFKHPINIIVHFPKRLIRLGLHFFPFIKNNQKLHPHSFIDWIFDLPFYIIDIIGIPELIETIVLLTNPSIRSLAATEFKIASDHFQECCNLNSVMMKSNAYLFTRNYALAYVTFNIINYHENIEAHILNHELVHIAQFQKFGSVYIYRALKAQVSKEGYDYGGYYGLSKRIASGKRFEDLNFEQQAQFIEDYTSLLLQGKEINSGPYSYYYKQFKNWFNEKL